MQEQDLDGMVLASAGIKRLGMEDKITDYFDPMKFLPAIGQGALGIECLKSNENKEIYKEINDSDTRIRVEAERSFMRALNGDCHTLIGAYSKLEGNILYLIGTYMVDGKIVKKDISGNKEQYLELGSELGNRILRGV